MNYRDYVTQSEQTLSKNFYLSKNCADLLHSNLGVLSELDELLENYRGIKNDNVNKMEEISDIFWYLAIDARIFNLEEPTVFETVQKDEEIIEEMLKLALLNSDYLKKSIFYVKEINEQYEENSKKLWTLAYVYCVNNKINVYDAMQKNQNKLSGRYKKGKFDTTDAVQRNLESERKILES